MVIFYLSFVFCCLLFVIRDLRFVIRCALCLMCYLLHANCNLLFAICYSLSVLHLLSDNSQWYMLFVSCDLFAVMLVSRATCYKSFR